jgi:hypothetical protein
MGTRKRGRSQNKRDLGSPHLLILGFMILATFSS